MEEPKNSPSDTFVDRVVEKVLVKEEEITLKSPAHRKVENILAIVGAAQALIVGILEALSHYGVLAGQRADGLPWFNIIELVVCVAPKTVGRATLGKYLDRLPIIGGGK